MEYITLGGDRQDRAYQARAADEIRAAYAAGKRRVLLNLPPGAGKTHMAADYLRRAAERGNRALFIAHRRELIGQCADRLAREHLEFGVMMGKDARNAPERLIQVASIQTLTRRINGLDNYPLAIIDECHLAVADSYGRVLEQISPRAVLGLSATPERLDGQGLGALFDVMVSPVTTVELVREGYLLPCVCYRSASVDVGSLRVRRGEFDTEQSGHLMTKRPVVGSAVDHYRRLASQRLAVLFAPTVEASLAYRDAFRAAGIHAEHIDANTPTKARASALDAWTHGRVRVMCNVNILAEGFDFPAISAVIDASPTASVARFLQRAGRGARPYPGQADYLYLDHASNTHIHGMLPQDAREWNLESRRRTRRIAKASTLSVCDSCRAVYRGSQCPYCGAQTRAVIELFRDGELKEAQQDPLRVEVLEFHQEKKAMAKLRGYRRGWAWHQTAYKFGTEITMRYLPKQRVPGWVRKMIAAGGTRK